MNAPQPSTAAQLKEISELALFLADRAYNKLTHPTHHEVSRVQFMDHLIEWNLHYAERQ